MAFTESDVGERPAVVFDVDGVLLDSLPAHLAICRDKSREYGLHLSIPTPQQLREMVRRGVTISPMKKFFQAVGFSEVLAQRADQDYERDFSRAYPVQPFDGVAGLLSRLSSAHVRLGLVTSNTLANVRSGLGDLMRHFGDFAFTRDHPREQPKANALRELLGMMRVAPDRAIYVGDQMADATAAEQVGVHFIGATYGWGLGGRDVAYSAATPAELGSEALRLLGVAPRERARAHA